MQPLKTALKSDPAPSKWAYRLERLMLTPLFRRALRIGVPFCLTFVIGTIYFSDKDRQEILAQKVIDIRQQIETRPEFMVNLLAVGGVNEEAEAHIRSIFPYEFPASSFDLDLAEIQALITDLPYVASAAVRIRRGGVMALDVVERKPVALWRTHNGLGIVDIEGVVIGAIENRAIRADLPVVAGDGADRAIPEALEILKAAAPLGTRVKGLVRMGERRWDVVLDREQRILLPEVGAARALERVIVLHQAKDMLERDLAVVDMRLSDRPTLRMTKSAQDEWWRVVKLSVGTNEQ